ncbi:unnamed protein product [Trichogramma brassicae]|uniref:MAP7 domain-containing protein n=1 Tax=Trichogramma brassicae TaxID=86971 RepID=A0A6H5IC12_9HYME|nr:unnamed protein product [Trichogramma brassicae]
MCYSADLRRSRSSQFDADSLDGDHPYEHQGRESSGNNVGTASGGLPKDIDRAKLVRERQQEERQRKLEEIRQQALAAQRFREQRDEERRRRIEELRSRDSDRRSQVEERKRQLWEAERERREAIIRKNQEREARIEAKRKNERSQIVFAFGSSTPRMLEPADTGGSAAAAASSSYWATRRATSTTNVMTSSYSAVGSSPAAQSHHHQASNHGSTLTRRSSERELDGGSKKRATSAGGLDRKPAGDDNDGIPAAGCATRFANRRRTDLVPTLPSPRDPQQQLLTPTSSGRSSSLAKSSPSSAGGLRGSSAGPGLRSGEVTPNSPSSRPPSALSQQNSGATGGSSVNLRPRTTGSARRPRPASIAGTGMSVSCYSPSELKQLKDSKPPLPKVHALQKKPTTPVSAVTPPSSASKSADRKSSVMSRSVRASPRATPKATPLQSPAVEQPPIVQETVSKPKNEDVLEEQKEPEVTVEKSAEVTAKSDENLIGDLLKDESSKQEQKEENLIDVEPVAEKEKNFEADTTMEGDIDEHCDMSASMIQKIRITTEEEAKAALAERRRLAREQAEREAELERLRLEEEARLEAERQRAEEEEQRRLEEETLRLAEEARKAEEQRLQQAIEEAKRREEEDRKRREEEARLKAEKEEAERKAREEAENKQNNVTNNLLDLSEFDMLSDTNNSNNTSNQILLMTNEDNLNSNLNPAAMEFTPSFGISNTNPFHQDPFVSKQQDNQLPASVKSIKRNWKLEFVLRLALQPCYTRCASKHSFTRKSPMECSSLFGGNDRVNVVYHQGIAASEGRPFDLSDARDYVYVSAPVQVRRSAREYTGRLFSPPAVLVRASETIRSSASVNEILENKNQICTSAVTVEKRPERSPASLPIRHRDDPDNSRLITLHVALYTIYTIGKRRTVSRNGKETKHKYRHAFERGCPRIAMTRVLNTYASYAYSRIVTYSFAPNRQIAPGRVLFAWRSTLIILPYCTAVAARRHAVYIYALQSTATAATIARIKSRRLAVLLPNEQDHSDAVFDGFEDSESGRLVSKAIERMSLSADSDSSENVNDRNSMPVYSSSLLEQFAEKTALLSEQQSPRKRGRSSKQITKKPSEPEYVSSSNVSPDSGIQSVDNSPLHQVNPTSPPVMPVSNSSSASKVVVSKADSSPSTNHSNVQGSTSSTSATITTSPSSMTNNSPSGKVIQMSQAATVAAALAAKAKPVVNVDRVMEPPPKRKPGRPAKHQQSGSQSRGPGRPPKKDSARNQTSASAMNKDNPCLKRAKNRGCTVQQ